MLFWLIILTIYLGLVVFSQAMKHSWEQWYYGRLNRRTLERWHNERALCGDPPTAPKKDKQS